MHARRLTRAVALIASIAILTVTMATPASAGDEDANVNSSREIRAEALGEGEVISVRDSPWNDCTYKRTTTVEIVIELITGLINPFNLVAAIDVLQALAEGDEQTGLEIEGELAYWQDVTCPNGLLEPGGRALWPVGDAIPQRIVDALRRQASENKLLPLFYANGAPSGSGDDPFVTGVETHLWLDSARFSPVQSVAEIPDLVRVTVTATPRDPIWNAGDGTASFTCNGPGEPWNDGDRVAECGHTYRNSTSTSGSGTFTLAVTTIWDVQYECVNLAGGPGCGSAALPQRMITSTRPVQVAEIQAIVTDA